ncbi:hypothetical protein H6F89_09055 [Cyanobacteria bacterium FACHB-63]|nr:hypothetical protein [Cyanobacteria bacterium FACHB-63]
MAVIIYNPNQSLKDCSSWSALTLVNCSIVLITKLSCTVYTPLLTAVATFNPAAAHSGNTNKQPESPEKQPNLSTIALTLLPGKYCEDSSRAFEIKALKAFC